MGSLLERLLDRESRSADTLAGRDARAAVDAVLAAATRHDMHALVAASPAAERLVGAAVYAAAGSLSVWRAGSHDEVLVVDSETLSDLAVSQTVDHVRLSSRRVAAVIVNTDPVASDVADVVVLRHRLSA